MAARISVMGSSLPSDRLLLLSCLKDKGHTVAMVGNRTNDIPMLKAADVGLTFATRSTDIARKSTDIIIMEGNFTSILAIMKCGRCIYSSMRKYIQFQLAMTLAGALIPLITDASHGSSPITTIQLHWAISVWGAARQKNSSVTAIPRASWGQIQCGALYMRRAHSRITWTGGLRFNCCPRASSWTNPRT